MTTTWEKTQDSQSLPPLSFPITLKTLMIEAAGTRDFMPYHWHGEFTRTKGMRDAFVNSMFYQGLIGRYVSDWAGPHAIVRSATLSMLNQICPGDTAVVEGTITKRWQDGQDALVQVDVTVSNHIGLGAQSRLVVALVDDAGRRPAIAVPADAEPAGGPAEVPDWARQALDREVRVEAPYPVSEQQIGLFCELVRDANPLYSDPDFANTSVFGGVIAPPQSLLVWMMPKSTQCGPDYAHPDVDLPSQSAWPAAAVDPFFIKPPNTKDVIATNQLIQFYAPIRLGDKLHTVTRLVGCSQQKTTKIGTGYFMQFLQKYYNHNDELLASLQLSIFYY